MQSFSVGESSEVAQARRAVSALAVESGFGLEDAGRVALITTEIGSNLIKHGGGGEIIARVLADGDHSGIELLGLDQGPGMVDVAKCLRDGYSTGGSPGTGLGAIERLSQQFDIYSQPEKGTAVLARLWPDQRAPRPAALETGAIVIPKRGETESGDAWSCVERASGVFVLAADGLGHGRSAAEAANAACRVFQADSHRAPAALLQLIHTALRPTRGAAITLLDIDWQQGQLVTAGVGNIVTAVVTDNVTKRIPTDNGIVGHTLPRIRELTYPCPGGSVLIVHSDGLGTHWQVERYPGLMQRHAAVIAGVLYRDYTRGRDDTLVVVMKWTQS